MICVYLLTKVHIPRTYYYSFLLNQIETKITVVPLAELVDSSNAQLGDVQKKKRK